MYSAVSQTIRLVAATCVAAGLTLAGPAMAESPDSWFREGRAAVEAARARKDNRERARSIILFVGDGMGISTVSAARIFAGEVAGQSGERHALSFESFPDIGLVKTYNTNQQVPDSAGTMSAIATGVKTRAGVISVDQQATRGDFASAKGRSVKTILEIAEEKGLATGIVTTARVTHATPAALYAHSPERDWECDADLPSEARDAGFQDIARQLLSFSHGDGPEVVLGGGRREFLPEGRQDPEHQSQYGRRLDGEDLTAAWMARPGSAYVWNRELLAKVDTGKVSRLLGLFEPSHMNYEHDRAGDEAGEPSLAEMTARAIEILSRQPKGYFLMVEGARIDHAHHLSNAYRALSDTVAFEQAVARAVEMADEHTLILVTADHSHVFTMGGYPIRGNPILGKVVTNDRNGRPRTEPARDADGRPYTTLFYANGPGYRHGCPRPSLEGVDTANPDYQQESGFPLPSESHGGEDVPLYARGPSSYLFRGVMEQHVLFHAMSAALGFDASGPGE